MAIQDFEIFFSNPFQNEQIKIKPNISTKHGKEWLEMK